MNPDIEQIFETDEMKQTRVEASYLLKQIIAYENILDLNTEEKDLDLKEHVDIAVTSKLKILNELLDEKNTELEAQTLDIKEDIEE